MLNALGGEDCQFRYNLLMAEVQLAPIFDVILLRAGEHIAVVVKAIRRHTELGLPETARLIAQAPATVLRGAGWAQAEAARRDLAAAGARVLLRRRRGVG